MTPRAIHRFLAAGTFGAAAAFLLGSAPAWAAGGTNAASVSSAVVRSSPTTVSGNSHPAGTETFSGARSSTPFIPSSQPIYSPPVLVVPSQATTASHSGADTFVAYRAGRSTLAFSGSFDGPIAAVGGLCVLSGLGLVRLSRRRPVSA